MKTKDLSSTKGWLLCLYSLSKVSIFNITRKALLVLAVVITTQASFAQGWLYESFEGAEFPPPGWTIIDQDGDEFNWHNDSDMLPIHSGVKCAISASYDNASGPLAPENYLITPEIDLSNNIGLVELEYWVHIGDATWASENYKVIVSTTGNTITDFNNGDIVFEEEMLAYTEYQQRIIDLNSYSGSTIHIAFVHYNTLDMYLLLLDDVSVGEYSSVSGSVFNDANSNCLVDSIDFGLAGFLVVSEPGPNYAITSADGSYSLKVGLGSHQISIQPPNQLWQQNCPTSPAYHTVNVYDTINVPEIDFGVYATSYCPFMTVDISTWAIRPCFTSTYTVQYCNEGTSPADNATIKIEIPEAMIYVSGGNLISQLSNVLTFDIGNIMPGACGNFSFQAEVDCDMDLLGSTMCISAHIFPDSLCSQPDSTWDKSSVAVEGVCIDDSMACFTIYNTGDSGEGDMAGNSEYRIFENNLLVFTDVFQIDGGDSLIICWVSNGNTIRLEADQRPGHPGNSHPQDNVEMCGIVPDNFVTGQIMSTPEDDLDEFIEIHCLEVTGSYDPNDKQVWPAGLTDQFHYIDSTDVLEYMIRFQNTGTDTAFNIYVIDTISPFLDVSTIELGVCSHPYSFEIREGNILQWTFADILLPDSNVNESGSNGFLKFEINQKGGNSEGTFIENRAGIIFDFNAPIITNYAFNTIGDIEEIILYKPTNYTETISVEVYPNPFSSTTTFRIGGAAGNMNFELFNVIGQKQTEIRNINSNSFVFNREGIDSGIYIYIIREDQKPICTGKLIINGY